MAIKITDECINCGACEPECPNNAIYEGGAEWRFSDGTSVKGAFSKLDGTSIDADAPQEPKSMDIYYIVTDKCTECVGFHDEPQCLARARNEGQGSHQRSAGVVQVSGSTEIGQGAEEVVTEPPATHKPQFGFLGLAKEDFLCCKTRSRPASFRNC